MVAAAPCYKNQEMCDRSKPVEVTSDPSCHRVMDQREHKSTLHLSNSFPELESLNYLKLTYPSYNLLYRTVELFQWFPFKVLWRFLLLMLVLPKSLFRLFLKHKHDETTRIFTWCPQKDKWRPNE